MEAFKINEKWTMFANWTRSLNGLISSHAAFDPALALHPLSQEKIEFCQNSDKPQFLNQNKQESEALHAVHYFILTACSNLSHNFIMWHLRSIMIAMFDSWQLRINFPF